MLDIKNLFDQLDRLSEFKNMELLMLQRCKEALDLHGRLNGYNLKLRIYVLLLNSIFAFQMHARTGPGDEYRFFGHHHSLDNLHMQCIVRDREGKS